MPLPADRAHDAPHQQPDLPQEPQQDSLSRRLTTLPDGHPSSVNDEDGNPRKPTVNLRDLELPVDDRAAPADRKDSAERQELAVSDTWREQLPALQSLWDHHRERWPDKEKPKADRSSDEPGSWRSDSGHYLNPVENANSDNALSRVRQAEQAVTSTMRDIESSTPDASLLGLDQRLKGDDRCKEKVAREVRQMIDRSGEPIESIVDGLHDIVRYTYGFTEDRYTAGHYQVRGSLEERDYKLLLVRNEWENPEYKGVNTRWRSPEGQMLEVQFHTGSSFEGKQLTHSAYERLRSESAPDDERFELEQFQRLVSAKIPVPEGATEIPDYRSEDR